MNKLDRTLLWIAFSQQKFCRNLILPLHQKKQEKELHKTNQQSVTGCKQCQTSTITFSCAICPVMCDVMMSDVL